MVRTDFGSFSAVVPAGWTVGSDEDLIAVYPPDGDSYIQISTYRRARQTPSPMELWDLAEGSLEPSWSVSASAVRPDGDGFALDADGATEKGGALLAFRLWPRDLVFATFYHSSEDARHLPAARTFMESLRRA